jgi:predicted acyltransferase
VLLVVLGLIVNIATFPGPLRVPGVLQRIALCYLLAVLVVRVPRLAVAGVAILLLAGYVLVLRSGGMTPDHSAAASLDVALFGRRHLYHGFGYDPEGVLSSIAATTTVLLGYLTMSWLRTRPRSVVTGALVLSTGIALVVAGRALDPIVPINKRLWTPSFTLLTAGLTVCALAVLFVLIEVAVARRVAWPFEVLGANAIVLYVVSELSEAWLGRTGLHARIYEGWFALWAGARLGSLAFSFTFLLVLWGFAAALWRAHIIVRV